MLQLSKNSDPNPDTKPCLGIVIAEGIKFWTLPSNRVLTLVALLFVPVNALLMVVSLRQRAADPDITRHVSTVDAFAFLDSVLWLQLLIAIIAVLCATSENSGGLSMSFLATPGRLPVLAAKMVVIGCGAFIIGIVGSAVGQLLPAALLSGSRVHYRVKGWPVVMHAFSSGLYLAGIALIALCIAILVRNLVIALLTPIALFTIVPSILAWSGRQAGATLSGYFPTIAGRTAISAFVNPADLNALEGFLVLGCWALILAAGAAWAYRYRDA